MKLAIIGTAGRGPDGKTLTTDPERYLSRMMDAARKVAELTGSTELVSGGASWADHIAVLLYLSDPQRFTLELELPAPLIERGDTFQYEDRGTGDFRDNPGAVSNHYHRLFKKAFAKTKPEWSPFGDFRSLEGQPRVTTTVTHGFLARNLKVADKADHCLAMTFGERAQLKDGGTAHTMSAFRRRGVGTAWHLDLNTLKLYPNATT